MTNNLQARIVEHYLNRGNDSTFAGKFHCYNLLYYERYQYVQHAIEREKQIKNWNRQKKLDLVATINPTSMFLNEEVCGTWPPPAGVEQRNTYQ
jgi:putative endonuclease